MGDGLPITIGCTPVTWVMPAAMAPEVEGIRPRREAKYGAIEVTSNGDDDDANLRIPVRLTLRNPGGQEVEKNVVYVVGTSPVLTVFREMFR